MGPSQVGAWARSESPCRRHDVAQAFRRERSVSSRHGFRRAGRHSTTLAAVFTAVCSAACGAQPPASPLAADPCRYLTADDVVPYVGALISPPYRAQTDNPVPSATGAACLYRGRDGREVLVQHASGGARAAGALASRIPTVTDRTLHNADPSSAPGQSNPPGGASAIMGSAGPGPWDNSNWYPSGNLIVYKADDAVVINVSGASGGKAAAVDLATRAIRRLAQPLRYDGAAAVAQAPRPVRPMPPCDLVPRARAEAVLGPLAADPAPDPDGKSCTYVVGSADGRVSYELGITWSGGYKQLNTLKHSTSTVSGAMGSTQGGQTNPGMGALTPQGGAMQVPKLDGGQQKMFNAFTKAVGVPGMGSATKRGLATDTTLAGPWDTAALINGSWLVVVKRDVGLTMILGTADYDKAKALMAAACEHL